MDEWLTVEEVAELLKITERAVQKNAASGKYNILCEEGKRGGAAGKIIRIALSSLPSHAQVEYLQRKGFVTEPQTELSDGFDQAPAKARKEAARRLAILKAADQYIAKHRSKVKAIEEFVHAWNAANAGEALTVSTLYRWQQSFQENGRCGLLPKYGKSRGQSNIDPRALDLFKRLYFDQSQRSIRSCWRDVVDMCCEQGWRVPDLKAFERYVKTVPEAAIIMARKGPEAFRNECAPYIERDPESIAGNQIWVSDHYEFDCMVKGQNGTPVRPWLTAWVDMRSFKFIAGCVSYSPNTDTIMAAFAKGATDKNIGLPREIYTDNGRDYCSKEFAGTGHRSKKPQETQEERDQRVQTLVESLGIIPHFAIPKNARAKIAERVFRVIAENFCTHFPTYTGSNTEERPERLKEVLKKPELIPDIKDFQRKFDAWVTTVYNTMESTGKGRKGECPDETFERTRGPVRLASPEALRLCLMRHSQPVTVGRHGVRLWNQNYYNPELIRYLGEKVYLRYRDEDMSKVHVFNMADSWLCDAELKRMLPAVRADKEDIREARRIEKRAKRIAAEHLKISEEAAAYPNPLDRALAKKERQSGQAPISSPKVVEMAHISRNLKESAEQIAAANAVGQNTARITNLLQHAGPIQQSAEERRIKASDVLRILNKPKE